MSQQAWVNEFREGILAFVWRQWAQLGLGAASAARDTWCQDPEALLVFSLEVARLEPRLFDELLDWLRCNGGLLSWQRLKNLLAEASPETRSLVEASLALTTSLSVPKPLGPPPAALFPELGAIAPREAEPTFLAYGWLRHRFTPSQKSKPPHRSWPIAYAFQLRGLFGNSARSEALRYLALRPGHQAGTTEIAEAAQLGRLAVHQVLEELHEAGGVQKGQRGRKDLVWWLEADQPWLCQEPRPTWLGWVSLYRGLSLLWHWLMAPERASASPYMLASGARGVLKEAAPLLLGQGLKWRYRDADEHPGPGYWEVFQQNVAELLRALEGETAPRPRPASLASVAHTHFQWPLVYKDLAGDARAFGKSYPGRLELRWHPFEPPTARFLSPYSSELLLTAEDHARQQPSAFSFKGEVKTDVTLHLPQTELDNAVLAWSKLAGTTFHFHQAVWGYRSQGDPCWVRYVLSNVAFWFWPDGLQTEQQDTLHFASEGQVFSLTRLDARPPLAALTVPADVDERLDPYFVRDVAMWLTFLMGGPVGICASQSFDAQGNLLQDVRYDDTPPLLTGDARPFHWLDLELTPKVFASFFESFRRQRDRFDLYGLVNCLVGQRAATAQIGTLLRLQALRAMATRHLGPSASVEDLLEALKVTIGHHERLVLAGVLALADSGELIASTPRQGRAVEHGLLMRLSNAAFLRLLGYDGPVSDQAYMGVRPADGPW